MMTAHPHENIVQFHDCYLVNDTLWVVMEYLEGRALTKLLQELLQGKRYAKNCVFFGLVVWWGWLEEGGASMKRRPNNELIAHNKTSSTSN